MSIELVMPSNHLILCHPLFLLSSIFPSINSVQFSSVAQSCPTLCDPMNRSTPGLPVHHHLPEFTQIHVHQVFSNESALHIRWPKYWSFRFNISPTNEHPGLISFRMDWLDSSQSKGLSRVFSNTTVQKHKFFGAQPFSQSNSHIHTGPLGKP